MMWHWQFSSSQLCVEDRWVSLLCCRIDATSTLLDGCYANLRQLFVTTTMIYFSCCYCCCSFFSIRCTGHFSEATTTVRVKGENSYRRNKIRILRAHASCSTSACYCEIDWQQNFFDRNANQPAGHVRDSSWPTDLCTSCLQLEETSSIVQKNRVTLRLLLLIVRLLLCKRNRKQLHRTRCKYEYKIVWG